LTIFLAEVPTGVLADRFGSKGSVILSLVLQLSGEVLYLFVQTYAGFALSAILAGVGFAFASGATEALVYESLPEENREEHMKRAMGSVNSAGQIGFFIAPLIGGVIVSEFTPDRFMLAIALTACSVAVALLISLTLREVHDTSTDDPPGTLTVLREGVGELRKNAALRRVVLMMMFTATFGGSLLTFSQPYLKQNGASPFTIGAALAVGSLVATLTAKYAYLLERAFGKRGGVLLSVLVPGALYIVLAAASGAAPIFALFVLLYGTVDVKNPLFSAYQNALIDNRSRATLLSLMNMLGSLYVAGMSVVYGAVADRSLPLAFALIGGVLIGAALLLRVDKLPLLARRPTKD
jgi:MFS family permease